METFNGGVYFDSLEVASEGYTIRWDDIKNCQNVWGWPYNTLVSYKAI